MLSGGTPILMRVRISFDALRLCLLVAAGVTSGYLWRAAFESSSPAEQRIAAPPRVIDKAPAPPPPPQAPDDEARRGWGKGDDNHDHPGPGGDDGDKGKGKDKGK